MKRMFDKEEIVDLIQEESPKIEVDSELSETSENPVQNKVITEALGEVLPDTTGQTDKFLKVGSDGLEWAEAGGKLYIHNITFSSLSENNYNYIKMSYISKTSSQFTAVTFVNELNTKGVNSRNNALSVSGAKYNGANSLAGIYTGIFSNGTSAASALRYVLFNISDHSRVDATLSPDFTDEVIEI